MSGSVKPKLAAGIAVETAKIINLLVDVYRGVDLSTLRTNVDFVLHICNVIEATFAKGLKVDKKMIAVDIIKKLVPSITDDEMTINMEIIEHCHSTGAIKKPSVWKIVKYAVICFLKNVLSIEG